MRRTMVRTVLASGLFFACSANAWPAQSLGYGHDKPTKMRVACEIHLYDDKGETESWRCMACIGNLCSPAWLSDYDQSGNY